VQQFANKVSLTIDANHFLIKENLSGRILYKGISNNGLHTLPRHQSLITPPQAHSTTAISLAPSWHCSLGHSSSATLQTLHSQLPLFSIPKTNPQTPHRCSVCQLDRSVKLSFSPSQIKSTHPLQLIHSDLWGMSLVVSNSSYRYYVMFIDDWSRFL